MGRTVAVKLVQGLDPESGSELMASEARAMASVPPHPNVVGIYDVVEAEDCLALVMEHVQGRPLSSLLRDHPSGLPWSVARPILAGILAGMAHVHRLQIIHRDLKPGNIMILDGPALEPGSIKVLDFGLARRAKEASTQYTKGVAGTYAYMSPEQFNEQPQAPATDVYALGILAFEMIGGRPPFTGPACTSFTAYCNAHTYERPPALSAFRLGLPAALEACIQKALAKDPRQRYPDAGAFAEALLPILDELAATPLDPRDETTWDARMGIPARSHPTRSMTARSLPAPGREGLACGACGFLNGDPPPETGRRWVHLTTIQWILVLLGCVLFLVPGIALFLVFANQTGWFCARCGELNRDPARPA
jgi:serine/threonine-protein kinase